MFRPFISISGSLSCIPWNCEIKLLCYLLYLFFWLVSKPLHPSSLFALVHVPPSNLNFRLALLQCLYNRPLLKRDLPHQHPPGFRPLDILYNCCVDFLRVNRSVRDFWIPVTLFLNADLQIERKCDSSTAGASDAKDHLISDIFIYCIKYLKQENVLQFWTFAGW